METELNNIAKEALQREKVVGFLCIDAQGLSLSSSGKAGDEATPGLIASIALLANKLEPGLPPPVIQIESSQQQKILIRSKDSITTALFKSN